MLNVQPPPGKWQWCAGKLADWTFSSALHNSIEICSADKTLALYDVECVFHGRNRILYEKWPYMPINHLIQYGSC